MYVNYIRQAKIEISFFFVANFNEVLFLLTILKQIVQKCQVRAGCQIRISNIIELIN